MKKAKKIVALLLCALLLIGASVAGTLAYLTDNQDVTNTFTIGKVEIKLDEAVVEKETGKAPDTTNRTEDGNTEVRMIPGRTIDKDPTVTVLKDSEACYVRVKVTVHLPKWTPDAAKAAEWMTDGQEFDKAFESWAERFAENYFVAGSVHGFNYTDWELSDTKIDSVAKEITYTLCYKNVPNNNIVPKSTSNTELSAVFDKVVAPKTLTKDQLALLEGMEIKVEAHAIQAEGFTNATAAWTEFDKPNP